MDKELEVLYENAIKDISITSSKLKSLIKEVIKKYPCDSTRKLALYSQLITEIVEKDTSSSYSNEDKVKEISSLLSKIESPNSDKKEIAKGDSDFDINEVLFPKGELDLMELCKELGAKD